MPLPNGNTLGEPTVNGGLSALEAELLRFDPCHFPSLSLNKKALAKVPTFASCELSFNLPNEAREFSNQEGADSTRICLAAWALVVQCYTGAKSVCFAHLKKHPSAPHQANDEPRDSQSSKEDSETLEIMLYDVDFALPVHSLFQQMSLNERFAEKTSTVNGSLERMRGIRGIDSFNTGLLSDENLDEPVLSDQFSLLLSIDSKNLYNGCEQRILLKYSTSLLDEVSAPRILQTYKTALEDVLSQPTKLQGEIRLLSDYDESLMWKWNTATIEDPVEGMLHYPLEQHAKQCPDKEAVYAWNGSFTFFELNQLADRLAAYLYNIGVRRNDIVPMCWEKSKWLPVIIFGVLKAGGANAVLDISNPAERRRLMIGQIKARTVISQDTFADDYLAMDLQLVVDIPSICAGMSLPSSVPSTVTAAVSTQDLAYVGFTSGSMGIPKAVLHTHFTLSNWVYPAVMTGYRPDSRVLNFATHGWITGFSEIADSIRAGGTVCIPSEADRSSDIGKFMSACQPTHAFFTPSFLRTLKPHDIPKGTMVCTGGEMVERQLLEKWRGTHYTAQGYGQTEGATLTDYDDGSTIGCVPLRSAAWITMPGQFNRLAPIGAIGELSIQSAGVFNGYLNDSALTQAKLPERPTWMRTNGVFGATKMLSTGDWARLESDGTFTILGRADSQVKIHGQRVELTEIEHRIKQNLPKGAEVAVDLIRPADSAARSILTAMIVLPAQADDTGRLEGQEELKRLVPALEASLSRVLPRYMIPKAFDSRSVMPYTNTGKLQRKALNDEYSALDMRAFQSLMVGSDQRDPPETDSERRMQSLWAQALDLDASLVGRDDNFFALGGDSLLVIKLIAHARQLGLEITAKMLFENPVLSSLSNIARSAVTCEQDTEDLESVGDIKLPPWLDKSHIESIHQASDAQAWMASAATFKTHGWVDYLMYDIEGPLDEARLRECCKKLIEGFDILRIAFVVHQRRTYQLVLKHVPLRMRKLKVEGDDQLDRASQWIFQHDLQRHLIVGQPYTAFVLISASPTKSRLMLRLSHAQYDASCYSTFGDSLGLAYSGKQFSVSPSFSKYLDFTRSVTPPEESARFWEARLKGARIPKLIERSEPMGPAYRNHHNTDIVRIVDNPRLHGRGVSSAVVIKAAWAAVLASITGDPDVTFGDFVSTRSTPLPGVEAVVGACLNFPPFRVNIKNLVPHSTILDYLKFVQEEHLAGIAHETRGFRDVIESCSPWPKWERLSSVVNCVTLDPEQTVSRKTTWNDGELTVTPGYLERWHDKSDLWLLTIPSVAEDGERSLEVTLRFNDGVIERQKAEAILGLYCQTVDDFAMRPDQPFTLPKLPQDLDITAPLGTSASPRDDDLAHIGGITFSQYWQTSTDKTVHAVVKDVWGIVFGDIHVEANTEFYEIWGDLIVASQMQMEYYVQGIFLDVEVIIANPTMEKQMGILAVALLEGNFR